MIDTNQILDVLKNDYSKDIIVAIASGLFLLLVQFLYKYIKNTISYKKYRGYTGNYFTYTISTKKSRNISCFSYRIKFKLGRLILVSNDRDLKYKGEVLITDKNIYFYSKGIDHEEYNHMIFHKPLNNKLTFSVGVFSGVSIMNEPTSKVILISNKKMEEEDAKRILQSYAVMNEDLLTIIPMSESFYTNEV